MDVKQPPGIRAGFGFRRGPGARYVPGMKLDCEHLFEPRSCSFHTPYV